VAFDVEDLATRLSSAWSVETATTWSSENPAKGQCSVTALAVQDLVGGQLLKTRVGACWHYYNLIGGEPVDLTSSQFDDPITYDHLPATREEALSDTSMEQLAALHRALGSMRPIPPAVPLEDRNVDSSNPSGS
jgi:hypothetical protein